MGKKRQGKGERAQGEQRFYGEKLRMSQNTTEQSLFFAKG